MFIGDTGHQVAERNLADVLCIHIYMHMPREGFQFYKQRREVIRRWLYTPSLHLDWMMTVNYKAPLRGVREARKKQLREDLQRWNCKLLESMFGKKFSKKNQNHSFWYVAFIQTGSLLDKEHVHLLLRVPFFYWLRFRKASRFWRSTDDIKIELVRNNERAIDYCTRHLLFEPEDVLYSHEFRRTEAV